MNVGDKIVCNSNIKHLINNVEIGKVFIVNKIAKSGALRYLITSEDKISTFLISHDIIIKHFCTLEEYRRLKLKKIENA